MPTLMEGPGTEASAVSAPLLRSILKARIWPPRLLAYRNSGPALIGQASVPAVPEPQVQLLPLGTGTLQMTDDVFVPQEARARESATMARSLAFVRSWLAGISFPMNRLRVKGRTTHKGAG